MTRPRAHHYGLTVADLERAVDFYRDVVGFAVVDRFSVSGEGFATGVGVPGASAEFAHLDAGDTRLELVSYDPVGDDRSRPRVNDPGVTHLGVTVDDVDAFYADLPDHVTTVSDPQTTASGTRICFLRDPESNLVEILDV